MTQHIHGFRNKSSHGTRDMSHYLREFEHTFMLEFAQIYFFQRLASFQMLSLKDLSRCMIFLNFFIKRISLIFDLGLTDERDLEKPITLNNIQDIQQYWPVRWG